MPLSLRYAAPVVLLLLAPPALGAQQPRGPDRTALQRILVAEDARGHGADGLGPLLDALGSPDSVLRRVAVRGLGRLQRPELGLRLVASLARQGELTWVLARLEAEWLEVAEALERAES